MSDEEGKAIWYFGEVLVDENDMEHWEIVENLIEKQQKVIDLMAFEIAENTGSCPLDIYDWRNKKYDNCNNCNDTYKECFIDYYTKKAEEENN